MARKELIFVIKDSAVNSSIITSALGDEYAIGIYTSGGSALSAMEKVRPDLVLLDLLLPGMDGKDMLRFLKNNRVTRRIPVIILSSRLTSKDEEECLMLGASDFIRRPVTPAVLQMRVRNQVDIMRRISSEHSLTGELLSKKECSAVARTAVSLLKSLDTGAEEYIEDTRELFTILAEGIAQRHPHLLNPSAVFSMAWASMLHDIGKAHIRRHILNKSDPLLPEEVEEIRLHPCRGAAVIQSLMKEMGKSDFLEFAHDIAMFHHEKWDGSGYPFKLRGEDIPLGARIMSLVDVYSALTHRSRVRNALPHQEAVRIITDGDDRTQPGHFDPVVIEAFMAVEKRFAEWSF